MYFTFYFALDSCSQDDTSFIVMCFEVYERCDIITKTFNRRQYYSFRIFEY